MKESKGQKKKEDQVSVSMKVKRNRKALRLAHVLGYSVTLTIGSGSAKYLLRPYDLTHHPRNPLTEQNDFYQSACQSPTTSF